VLDADETKRRLVAARTLRNLSQTALDDLGAGYGLDKQELSRTERGELPMTGARRAALINLLKLPQDWFTAASADDLLHYDPSQLDRLERKVSRLAGDVRELLQWAQEQELGSVGGQGGQPTDGHEEDEGEPGAQAG
jgi:transcriptional regulator with XRE-family HTH domain